MKRAVLMSLNKIGICNLKDANLKKDFKRYFYSL